MFSDAFVERQSPIHRCDARVRVLAAAVLSFAVAIAHSVEAQLVACTFAILLALVAQLPARATIARLLPLNVFLLLLWLFLPFTSHAADAAHSSVVGPSKEGAMMALGITLRANAIVLLVTALIATLDIVEFGRALHALRVPPKLVTLLLFTVRYTAVLHSEYNALRRAMRVRCFTPRTNLHTLRALGYLAGMLLVRGFERSARVLMAMKCRGYTGAFPVRDPRNMQGRDWALGALATTLVCSVAWLEWR